MEYRKGDWPREATENTKDRESLQEFFAYFALFCGYFPICVSASLR
jgi:hypothetical protein